MSSARELFILHKYNTTYEVDENDCDDMLCVVYVCVTISRYVKYRMYRCTFFFV